MPDEIIHKNDIAGKDRLFIKFIIFIPCLIVLFRSLDNDIWWLLNSGRYVLQHGIPHTEPFTVHQGFHFVMQQWLSDIIFWVTYSHLGAIGLKVLVMLFYALTVYIIYKLCMKISGNYFILSFLVTFAVSLILSFFMVSRPFIFSSAIFALELYLLESYRLSNKSKYLLFLPVLSLLLINMEAALWPMLFIIIAPYVLETFKFKIGPVVSEGAEKKYLFIITAVMVLVGFLNPYGFEAMTYLLRSYGNADINKHIKEMLPADITVLLGQIVITGILIITMIYCRYRNGKFKLRYILLTVGTAYMALSSMRSLLLFTICGFFPLAAYLKDFEPKIKQKPVTKKTLRLRKILIVLIVLLIPVTLLATNSSNITENQDYALLNTTIDHILNKKDASKVILYTSYNTGGMAEFRGLRTYMDPRAEVFVKKNNKKADVLDEYFNMQAGTLYYKDVLKKYHFNYLIVTKGDILYTYLPHDSDYKAVYSNAGYTLYNSIK